MPAYGLQDVSATSAFGEMQKMGLPIELYARWGWYRGVDVCPSQRPTPMARDSKMSQSEQPGKIDTAVQWALSSVCVTQDEADLLENDGRYTAFLLHRRDIKMRGSFYYFPRFSVPLAHTPDGHSLYTIFHPFNIKPYCTASGFKFCGLQIMFPFLPSQRCFWRGQTNVNKRLGCRSPIPTVTSLI